MLTHELKIEPPEVTTACYRSFGAGTGVLVLFLAVVRCFILEHQLSEAFSVTELSNSDANHTDIIDLLQVTSPSFERLVKQLFLVFH